MEVVASLSQGHTAAAQCGLFTYKSVPVIFKPPCIIVPPINYAVRRLPIFLANGFREEPDRTSCQMQITAGHQVR